MKLGEFQNVKLSPEEVDKLNERLGPEVAATLIDELSEYVASKAVRYRSHYATLLSWARRKGLRRPPERPKLSDAELLQKAEAIHQDQVWRREYWVQNGAEGPAPNVYRVSEILRRLDDYGEPREAVDDGQGRLF